MTNLLESSDASAAIATLSFDSQQDPYLLDHAVRGISVVSGASMIAGLFAADPATCRVLRNLRFDNMLPLPATETVSLIACRSGNQISLTDESGRTIHAVMTTGAQAPFVVPVFETAQSAVRLNGSQFYSALRLQGNEYGAGFQGVVSITIATGTASAIWRVPDAQSSALVNLTVLIDACTHVAAASANLKSTYVLKGIGQITLPDGAIGPAATITANTSRVDQSGCVASIRIDGSDGQLMATIDGLELVLLDKAATADESIAVAGSFTLDPLAQTVNMWARELNLSMGIQFAEYGQVFQELLSDEGVLNERAAMQISFLRLEDWVRSKHVREQPAQAKLDAIFGDLARHDLADGRTIVHLNRYETDYLYREIFVDLAYRRHGLGVLDNDTVIDIGANIGMFSLFASDQADNVRVIAIEPSLSVLPMLRANLAAYSPNATVIAAGGSDKTGEAEFTAYPNSSVFSTFSSDPDADSDALGAIIQNTLIASGHSDPEFLDQTVDELLDERLEAETYMVPLISVSDVIREHGVTQIGMLKLDAEKSEDAILAGIDAEHWEMIEQMIIEVHTQGGRGLEPVTSLLAEKGFEWVEDEEQLLSDSGLVTLYATRPWRREKVAANSPVLAVDKSADLYLDAIGARAASNAGHLLTVICPSTSRDPVLRASLDQTGQRLLKALNVLPGSEALTWESLTDHYRVDEIADEVSDQLGHVPYTPAWYASTATALVRRLVASRRAPYKVLALDCDNTLWRGVVGEVGASGIALSDGHLALQRFAKQCISRGMLVCLVSKNNETDVTDAFAQRCEFELGWDDCVAHRINWDSKSANLRSIAAELNLGLDAFIFIDDSPLECAEVRAAAPEVLTLQLPVDDAQIAGFLAHVWSFDQNGATDEDRHRGEMYQQETQRNEFKTSATSLETFIEGLELDIRFYEPSASQLDRVAQMTNRTNQFNLTTVRRSVADVESDLAAGLQCRVVDVADRFGNYGITGLVLFDIRDQQLVIDTLLLSCRVLGRGVEHALVAQLGQVARESGADSILFPFKDSGKNEPAKRFLDTLDATGGKNNQFAVSADTAVGLEYSVQTVNAAADAVATKAIKDLPPAPSLAVQSVASELDTVAAILERASTRVRLARPELNTPYVAPRNETETRIADIWSAVLGLTEVGIDDSFFELGGTSLSGVQMVVQLQKSVAGKVAVVDLFDAPTIRALAQVLEGGTQQRVAASKERGAARRRQTGARRRVREPKELS